jgi:hypothetical protein
MTKGEVMRRFLASALRCTLVAAVGAIGATAAYADNATYDPATKTIAGTAAFTDSYTLVVTSPSNFGGSPRDPKPFPSEGVDADIEIEPIADAVTGLFPPAGITVSPSVTLLTFPSFSNSHDVEITVDVPAGTPAGDYAYKIQADPRDKPSGWGVGEAILNVSVAEPVAVDTTPPTVVITQPVDATLFSFCRAGTPVSVTVEANDAESFVTAVFASVNGSSISLGSFQPANNVTVGGSFNASAVGTYVIKAKATSAGGTSDPEAGFVTVYVVYDVSWLPPLALGKTSKGGSTIPVKFRASDCTGSFMHDESVEVKIFRGAGATPVFSASFGEGSANVRIDDESEQYIVNFQTAAGANDYVAKVYFNGVLHSTRPFSVR